jgi:hypothetical protein
MELKSFLRANWDRTTAGVLVVLGALALLIGWIGVSGTGLAAEQNPYLISGGLLGIALIGVGCTVWLSADLQDEWRRLDALEEKLDGLGIPTMPLAVPVAADDGDGRDERVATDSDGKGRGTKSTRTMPAP